MYYVFLIAGLYLIVFSFILNTKNMSSAIIFKAIPFLIGLFNLIYGLNLLGILKLGDYVRLI